LRPGVEDLGFYNWRDDFIVTCNFYLL